MAKFYIDKLAIADNIFLAPMAGVSDLPFRELCLLFGAAFCYTEMVSAVALTLNNEKTSALLHTGDTYQKTGIQLFGKHPSVIREAAELAVMRGAVLIDINMGCPAPKIVKNGEGAALMNDKALVGKIISETARNLPVPVTVKIRKGFDKFSPNAVEIAKTAAESGAAAVCVHGRTRDMFYSGTADWDIITEVKKNVSVPVIGNGDVRSIADAEKMILQTGCDAVMIARAACGNPWLFADRIPTTEEKMSVALKHAKRLIEYKGGYVGVREMRKHMCWYVSGMKNAAKWKKMIVRADSFDDLAFIANEVFAS